MIRPFTLITAALAMVSGAYLFGVKHRAQVLDDQLAAVAQASRLDQQRIRVLQAQWALEIDPNRLQQLATQFSPLQPMKPAQLVSLTALAGMLPPVGGAVPASAVTVPLIASNDANGAFETAGAAVVAGAQVAMLPMPPPAAPSPAVSMASEAMASNSSAASGTTRHAVPSPAALRALLAAKSVAKPVRLASASRRNDASNLAHSEWAANLPPPRPFYAAQSPMGARVMSVSATPAVTSDASGDASGDAQGGSMLGIAADMAPPQPVSQGVSQGMGN